MANNTTSFDLILTSEEDDFVLRNEGPVLFLPGYKGGEIYILGDWVVYAQPEMAERLKGCSESDLGRLERLYRQTYVEGPLWVREETEKLLKLFDAGFHTPQESGQEGSQVLSRLVGILEFSYQAFLRAWYTLILLDLRIREGFRNPLEEIQPFLSLKGINVKGAHLISRREWESKRLTKGTLRSLGILNQVKLRSPKLSKTLASLLGSDWASALLADCKKSDTPSHLESQDPRWVWEQGNSIHYSSCQATDSRAKWVGGGSMRDLEGDLKFFGTELFFWTVGRPMSEDGKGFQARAKVRKVYKEGNLVGLLVDKIYGQGHLLQFGDLARLTEDFSDAALCLYHGVESGYEDLEVPSQEAGYQDTRRGDTQKLALAQPNGKSALFRAYVSRKKDKSGVYQTPLRDVKYHPQKGGFYE